MPKFKENIFFNFFYMVQKENLIEYSQKMKNFL
jgi:hypothetical protein